MVCLVVKHLSNGCFNLLIQAPLPIANDGQTNMVLIIKGTPICYMMFWWMGFWKKMKCWLLG
jgi:hypothetical protein